ncbi:MAG: AAA family ATPase [Eubacterium sp.]|nr:AAA family ATPase [Eubacterium sp.]
MEVQSVNTFFETRNEELNLIRMSDIEAKEVEWLWYPFIPYGKLTIIQGDPGDGKTTMVLNIAAAVSRGEGFDEGMNITEPMNVIYQTAEDGLADTVKPRLEQARADCSRVLVIDETNKALSMLDKRVEEALDKTGARLLIMDPIQAYLGGSMDMNRANEAREMTKYLATIAEQRNCAIILIGHMNKAGGCKAAYRGMGSIDFFAVARSVLLVGRVIGKDNYRAMVQIKNNLAPFGHPKAFELSEDGFEWIGDYEISVDDVLGGYAPKESKLDQAKQLLKDLSEDKDAVSSNELIELAKAEGISKRTMDNARKEMGLKSQKINNTWYVKLK